MSHNKRLPPELMDIQPPDRLIRSIAKIIKNGRIDSSTNKSLEWFLKESIFASHEPFAFETELSTSRGIWVPDYTTVTSLLGDGGDLGASYEFIAQFYDSRRKTRGTSGLPEISHMLNVAAYVRAFGFGQPDIVKALLHDYIENTCEKRDPGKLDALTAVLNDIMVRFGNNVAVGVIKLTDVYSILLREIHDTLYKGHSLMTPKLPTVDEIVEQAEVLSRTDSTRKNEYANAALGRMIGKLKAVSNDEITEKMKTYALESARGTIDFFKMAAYSFYVADLVSFAMLHKEYGLLAIKNFDNLHNTETRLPETVSKPENLFSLDRVTHKSYSILDQEGRAIQAGLKRKVAFPPELLLSYRALWMSAANRIDHYVGLFRDTSFQLARNIVEDYQMRLEKLKQDLNTIFPKSGQ